MSDILSVTIEFKKKLAQDSSKGLAKVQKNYQRKFVAYVVVPMAYMGFLHFSGESTYL